MMRNALRLKNRDGGSGGQADIAGQIMLLAMSFQRAGDAFKDRQR